MSKKLFLIAGICTSLSLGVILLGQQIQQNHMRKEPAAGSVSESLQDFTEGLEEEEEVPESREEEEDMPENVVSESDTEQAESGEKTAVQPVQTGDDRSVLFFTILVLGSGMVVAFIIKERIFTT